MSKRHDNNPKQSTKIVKVDYNNLQKVVESFGRMETLLQNQDRQTAQMGMDFMILQEYCMSVGGTQEGYVELHKKRMGEAEKMALDQAKMQQNALKGQHPEAPGPIIFGPDGKPMSNTPHPRVQAEATVPEKEPKEAKKVEGDKVQKLA